MRFSSLEQWLHWQESLHPSAIDLGLERPGKVLHTLGLESPSHTVITVAGTNGKGSSVAMLESILLAAGYRVGCYTSPHLLHYNERIRINGESATDEALCEAFERIDQARGDTSLTYFEFGTLAAIDLFARAGLDVAVLEVGLGGRLDAVNLLDADVALITAIDIDHAAWLGDDREAIGREKAGIFRPGRPAVCSDPRPPQSLLAYAEELGTPLWLLGRDFDYHAEEKGWSWSGGQRYTVLPLPALRGPFQLQNAAGVVKVLTLLADSLPVTPQHLRQGLLSVRLAGRFQLLSGEVPLIVDVAHNPQSAAALAVNLRQIPLKGQTRAVVAMLADKDLARVVRELVPVVEHWYVAGLDVWRGCDADSLAAVVAAESASCPQVFASLDEAVKQAQQEAGPGDRIVVFGSFHTVAAVLAGDV
ncbi:MAG: bifunctional tetrahydrofolate synthase/dihydrofolate synthase [Gammaproteobacteria bacterium]|nr:bifunctional tetrahydrofolate synthase/dihydrofolate synthase [Gammaproteobacteria bacterium]